MKRSIAFLILLLPLNTFALSLGEISVQSQYAQPLRASISIPSFASKDIDTLSIKLGSEEAYKKMDSERPVWLDTISLGVRVNENNRPYISIWSEKPVLALGMSLLIEVEWQDGKLVKLYDILFSPPKFDQQPNNSWNTPTQKQIKPEPETRQVLPVAVARPQYSQQARRSQPQLTRKKNGDLSFGPVLPGMSLSNVAEKLNGETKLNYKQRINILFQLNRGAFLNNDINQLQAGYTLRFNENTPYDDTLSFRKEPTFVDNGEHEEFVGEIIRLQEITKANESLSDIEIRLEAAKNRVEEYRKQNVDLWARLSILEEKAKKQAQELGLVD